MTVALRATCGAGAPRSQGRAGAEGKAPSIRELHVRCSPGGEAMRLYSSLCPLVPSVLAMIALPCAAQEMTVLAEFGDATKWYTAECDVSDDAERGRTPDTKAIHWHVPVDHTTGEPNYPVGWPRAGLAPQPHWDWSQYDFFEFAIYTETSRDALPATPLGINVSMPDRDNQLNVTIPAVKGEWVDYRISIEDLTTPTDVARVQWHISESNYKHGDTVDFYIADMALGRYVEPAVLEFRPLERLIDTGTTYLPIDLHVVGVEEGEQVEAEVLIRQGGESLASASASLGRGRGRVVLSLPAELPLGDAELAVRFGDEDAATAPLRIIEGPF